MARGTDRRAAVGRRSPDLDWAGGPGAVDFSCRLLSFNVADHLFANDYYNFCRHINLH
jgi:hypothetical protein